MFVVIFCCATLSLRFNLIRLEFIGFGLFKSCNIHKYQIYVIEILLNFKK